MIANEGNARAVGRELGIVAGSGSRIADLHARAVAQVIEPERAIGIEEQMRGVRRPEVAGHVVALAMIAVLLGAGLAVERSHFGGAHHHVHFAGDGIHIHQLAALEIGQMLSIGRPGERLGRPWNQRAVREEVFNRELLLRRLRRGVRSERQSNENDGKQSGGSRQREFLLRRKVFQSSPGSVSGRDGNRQGLKKSVNHCVRQGTHHFFAAVSSGI